MQAPRLALLPREKPGQWGSSQTCRDHGSLRAGQVTCSEGQHNHIRVWYGIYFPKLQKNDLKLLEVGVSQPSVCKGNYTKISNAEPLA